MDEFRSVVDFTIPPDEVFLDGIDLRNYEITYRRLSGETLEAIANDYGLTRESIRLIAQKTFGSGIEAEVKARKADRKLPHLNLLDEVRQHIIGHKGISVSELLAQYPTLQSSMVNQIGSAFLKFVNLEKEARVYATNWSDEQIITALAKAGTYHFPLARADYEELLSVGEIQGPSAALIMVRFSTWANACAQAGVEAHKTNVSYTKKWSESEQLAFVVEFLESTFPSSSIGNYEEWKRTANPHSPSSQLLRNTFGSWPNVVASALRTLRSEWTQEDQRSNSPKVGGTKYAG
jgi:uncharacterized protein (DUF433 family)